MSYSIEWAGVDLREIPRLVISGIPGPNSREMHGRAARLVYQSTFRKGLAWIPAGHILRMSPPIVMDLDVAAKCMDIVDESIGEVEEDLGYGSVRVGREDPQTEVVQ